jgi:hypothetical protein
MRLLYLRGAINIKPNAETAFGVLKGCKILWSDGSETLFESNDPENVVE